jgi:hypothetical protein
MLGRQTFREKYLEERLVGNVTLVGQDLQLG